MLGRTLVLFPLLAASVVAMPVRLAPLAQGAQVARALPDHDPFVKATRDNLIRSQRQQFNYAYKERRTEFHVNPFGRVGTGGVEGYEVTPTEKFFVRNNGLLPDAAKMPSDPRMWKVKIDGEVDKPMEASLGDIMARYEAVSLKLQLECGGNGRSFFTPEARGNQWTNGGAGCAEWTGVRLSDVLKAAGLK